MTKSLFEQLGGSYQRQGDYFVPCLTLPSKKEKAIGSFGRQHLKYLQRYHNGTYINLLTSGNLNSYLANIDKQAQERFDRLIKDMKQAQNITEQLKEEKPLEWAGKMNCIRSCAKEIVEKELIYA